MPVYNAERFVEKAILSVIAQTFKSWELIIIDDCSSDYSPKVIKNFLYDKRVRYYRLLRNTGVASARNFGLKKIKGDIICFLDADDYWDDKKLVTQKKYFDKGYKIIYSPYYRILQKGFFSFVDVKSKITIKNFYFYNPVPNLTGSFHKSLLPIKQIDDYHEDYLMWFNLVKKHGEAISTDTKIALAYYRTGNFSLSSNKFKALFWHWRILRKYFYLYALMSLYYFLAYIYHSIKIRVNDYLFASRSPNL